MAIFHLVFMGGGIGSMPHYGTTLQIVLHVAATLVLGILLCNLRLLIPQKWPFPKNDHRPLPPYDSGRRGR